VMAAQPDRSSNWVEIQNDSGGSRMLFDWSPISAEDLKGDNRKFMLALYQRQAVGAALTLKIGAYEIKAEWKEPTWKDQPAVAEKPFAEFEIKPDAGWRIFDITPLIRSYQQSGKPGFGVEFRALDENATAALRYGFEVQENSDAYPILLAIDPE
jgi:hypothetical protein